MCFFGCAGFLFTAWKQTQFHKENASRNKVFFRASGEAVSGTQRYFSKHFLILFRASGEAILGTQRHFIKALYASTLSRYYKGVAKVLQWYYKGITRVLQRYYKGITKVILNIFKIYPSIQGITKVLQGHYKGITTRYYDKIVNNSLSNIFVQLTYRGEVLRSITCF